MSLDYQPGSPPAFPPGSGVTIRGRDWTVVRLTSHADCQTLRLRQTADTSTYRTFLLPFDRPHPIERGRPRIVSARAWLRHFKSLLIGTFPYGGLRHCPSGIDLLPYQLEPALAMLRDGYPRLLIADAVGLGKTIEAGLIVRELSERQEELRALLLVPAGLRQQWSDELATRLGVAAIAADANWLRVAASVLPPDVNPWSPPGTYVASFDFVKRPEALRPLEDVRWDLLVVDEAHAAATTTDRRAAIDAIAARSRRLVLLTATPSSDPAELDALCRIGGGDPIVMFRRGRADHGRARRSSVLAVRLSPPEQRMHRVLERYTDLVWRDAGDHRHTRGRLAATVLRKRALSSAASLALSLRRRQDLLAGAPAPPELQLLLPIDDDAREDVVPDAVLGTAGLRNDGRERQWLKAVLGAAEEAAARESKMRVLVRLLRRVRQPAIVFTEYRDTLERLRVHLVESGLPACALHGGLAAAERREALTDFARGTKTLLATDAAAEGLNLQRTCRLVIHFELPWNPSRMLQRAGRVDRLGQRRRVHEIALVAADTAEAVVLAPLARRIARGGDREKTGMLAVLTESRVASAVFEGQVPDAVAPALIAPPAVTVSLAGESIIEALRLGKLRVLASGACSSAIGRVGVPVSTLRKSSLAPGVVLLFDLATGDEILERSLAAIHVELSATSWSKRPGTLVHQIAAILPRLIDAVSPVLDALNRRAADAVAPRFASASARGERRNRLMREVRESAARRLVQASLFDRAAPHLPIARRDRGGDLLDEPEPPVGREGGPSPIAAPAALRAVLVVGRR